MMRMMMMGTLCVIEQLRECAQESTLFTLHVYKHLQIVGISLAFLEILCNSRIFQSWNISVRICRNKLKIIYVSFHWSYTAWQLCYFENTYTQHEEAHWPTFIFYLPDLALFKHTDLWNHSCLVH